MMLEIISKITESTMTINIAFLDGTLRLTGFAIIISIVAKTLSYSETLNSTYASQAYIVLFKMLGYGFLSTYIYFHQNSQGITEIDVLTFFTFMLATFEAGHCFIVLFGDATAAFFRLIFRIKRG